MVGRFRAGGRSRPALVGLMLFGTMLVAVTSDSGHDTTVPTGGSKLDRAQVLAFTAARRSGQPVPVAEMTTPTTDYVALPDGNLRVTIAAGPVRARRDDQWVPVDLTLTHTTDGSTVPVAHPNDLWLSGAKPVGTWPVATVGQGDARIILTWTGALPQPVLSGERTT